MKEFMSLAAALLGCCSSSALAQAVTADNSQAQPAASEPTQAEGLGDIVVTAQKKSQAESAQKVPIAITAVSGQQIEANQLKNLSAVAQSIPNVQMDEAGTFKGTGAFTIRGLGINSTIPTLEATTGVFYDGIYIATTQGVLIDLFDLDGVEILRGPQGTLFGKNVTAGAVVVTSRAPSDTFEVRYRGSIETGLEVKQAASVSGPLTNTLKARLSVLYDHDNGWFHNDFTNSSVGKSESIVIRPSVQWDPTDRLNTTLRYEYGKITGDGSVSQQPALQDPSTFDVNYNFVGRSYVRWNQLTSQTNFDIGPGVLTNVAGYRTMKNIADSDIDGTTFDGFHDTFGVKVKQFSDELRYAASDLAGFIDLTTGLYYFHSKIDYSETRQLAPAFSFAPRTFGGRQRQNTYAAFAQADFKATDKLTVTAGLRYTVDKKVADLALLAGAPPGPCDPATFTCVYSSPDQHGTWKNWTPKVAVRYQFSPSAQVYASATRAYRAGGFNVRLTSPDQQMRFDQERTDAVEIGGKADFFGRRLRTNLALFNNKIYNLIRDVNTPTATGLVQDTKNTADVTIRGVEFESQFLVTEGLILNGFLGYTHGKYDKIRFSLIDLPGETVGTINAADYALKIPRLTPWNFGGGFTFNRDVSSDVLLHARGSISHRSTSAANEPNTLTFRSIDLLDGSIGVGLMNDKLNISIYGKNLLNQAYQGIIVGLPTAVVPPLPAGSRLPAATVLAEGRVIGAELSFKF